jgi:uncharacterized membrane protein
VSSAWIVILALAAGTVVIKAFGPVVLGGRSLPPRLAVIIPLLAPALLAALVVVDTFGGKRELHVDERALGVAAAAGVLGLRGGLMPAILVAAAVTATARALGV